MGHDYRGNLLVSTDTRRFCHVNKRLYISNITVSAAVICSRFILYLTYIFVAMEISGKVAFITGAAQGLGKAFAEALLERGAKVALGDINTDVGTATLQEFQKRFGEQNVTFSAFDVTNHQQFRDAFDSAVSTFGHIDVLVNNAGILHETNWELMLAINFTSMVFGTKLALEHMRKDKGGRGGRIINISSTAGLGDYYYVPVYCGTKHAVRAFTSSIALQPNIEELGIQFATLCPGAVSTDLHTTLDNDKMLFYDDFQKNFVGGTMEVSAVASALLELLQLEKMNGAILKVDFEEGISYRKMECVVCT